MATAFAAPMPIAPDVPLGEFPIKATELFSIVAVVVVETWMPVTGTDWICAYP